MIDRERVCGRPNKGDPGGGDPPLKRFPSYPEGLLYTRLGEWQGWEKKNVVFPHF